MPAGDLVPAATSLVTPVLSSSIKQWQYYLFISNQNKLHPQVKPTPTEVFS